MIEQVQDPGARKRRLFIKGLNNKSFQLFSFSQNERDGSIYSSWPDLIDTVWLSRLHELQKLPTLDNEIKKKQKLSTHGSGTSIFRIGNKDTDIQQVRISGNILLNKSKKMVGARHLFTFFANKPSFIPKDSPVFNRQGDYLISSTKELVPFVVVFFAVPRHGVSISLQLAIHTDRFEKIPDDLLGSGVMPLVHHDIFWFAYTTRNLVWPKHPHIVQDDGYHVPMFFGKEDNYFEIEVIPAVYSLQDRVFIINVQSTLP